MTLSALQPWVVTTTPSQAYAPMIDAVDEAAAQGGKDDSSKDEVIIEKAGGSMVSR